MSSTSGSQSGRKGSLTRNFINSKLVSKHGQVQPLAADKFLEIWNHYDQDGNQFLEADEIDGFLKDFLNSSLSKAKISLSDAEIAGLRDQFIKEFDTNRDGKISLMELSAILPAKERFFLLYKMDNERDENGLDYMKTWKKYDRDLSGFIEADELKLFLRDLIARADPDGQVNEKRLQKYTETIMEVFDTNKDGKLDLSELVHLLPGTENFVQLVLDKALALDKLQAEDVRALVRRYDKNGSGTLEGAEFTQLVTHLLQSTTGKQPSSAEVNALESDLLKGCDLDKDGRIDGRELTVILLAVANAGKNDAESLRLETDQYFHTTGKMLSSKQIITNGHDGGTEAPVDYFNQQVRLIRKNMHLMSYLPASDN